MLLNQVIKVKLHFSDIQDLLNAVFTEDLSQCTMTTADLLPLKNNFDQVQEALNFYVGDGSILKGYIRHDVEHVLKLFDHHFVELTELESIDKWLRDHKFDPGFDIPPRNSDYETISFEAIFERTSLIHKGWNFQSDSSLFSTLKFFVPRGSRLFEDDFAKCIADQKVDCSAVPGSALIEQLSDVVQQTVISLKNLVNDKRQTLSSITSSDIKGFLRSLKGRNNDIALELQLVSEYFGKQEDLGDDNIGDRTLRLNVAVELLRLTADVETHGFKVCPLPDAVTLRAHTTHTHAETPAPSDRVFFPFFYKLYYI